MVTGILVAGLSLIVAKARVRKLFAIAGVVAAIAIMTLSSVITTWLARGQGNTQSASSPAGPRSGVPFSPFHATSSRRSSVSACQTERSTVSRSIATGSPPTRQQGLFGVVVCATILLFLLVTRLLPATRRGAPSPFSS